MSHNYESWILTALTAAAKTSDLVKTIIIVWFDPDCLSDQTDEIEVAQIVIIPDRKCLRRNYDDANGAAEDPPSTQGS